MCHNRFKIIKANPIWNSTRLFFYKMNFYQHWQIKNGQLTKLGVQQNTHWYISETNVSAKHVEYYKFIVNSFKYLYHLFCQVNRQLNALIGPKSAIFAELSFSVWQSRWYYHSISFGYLKRTIDCFCWKAKLNTVEDN